MTYIKHGIALRPDNVPRPTDVKPGSVASGSSKGKENVR